MKNYIKKKSDWGQDRWNIENGFGNNEFEVLMDWLVDMTCGQLKMRIGNMQGREI